MDQIKVGFIGAGNMAASIITGLLNRGLGADCVFASDPDPERLAMLGAQAPIQACEDNAAVAAAVDVLVLAVKPQAMDVALAGLDAVVAGRQVVVLSIAAGLTLTSLEQRLGSDTAVVRSMPNTPALLGEGASALFANAVTSAEQREQVAAVLGAVGTVCWLDSETLLDAVTAVSGSGPAYFFLLMEAMIATGEKLGLDSETCQQLVVQTALGAARMAGESDVGLAELRRRVTSPGGTTAAALHSFEKGGFGELVESAVRAAADRSRELSEEME